MDILAESLPLGSTCNRLAEPFEGVCTTRSSASSSGLLILSRLGMLHLRYQAPEALLSLQVAEPPVLLRHGALRSGPQTNSPAPAARTPAGRTALHQRHSSARPSAAPCRPQ